MNQEKKRFTQRLQNFSKAFATLENALPRFEEFSEIEQDGFIQRFEFTFELSWKVMQDYLTYTGYKGLKGPRHVINQMGNDGLINPFVWIEMLEARNALTHEYDEEQSRTYLDKIAYDYIPAFQEFSEKMKNLEI